VWFKWEWGGYVLFIYFFVVLPLICGKDAAKVDVPPFYEKNTTIEQARAYREIGEQVKRVMESMDKAKNVTKI
jgi:hypothetical protein